MALREVAAAYYAAQALLARLTVESLLQVWRSLEPGALSASWAATGAQERLSVAVSTAQLAAVQGSMAYLPTLLAEQGVDTGAVGELVPNSLIGVASDGRDLLSLLLSPLIRAEQAIRAGAPPERAAAVGETTLAMIGSTQVQDAGRVAQQVAAATRPAVTGWVRMLNPPSCARCVILAGRVYRFSDGFERHPQDDCITIPAAEDTADDLRTSPEAYFRSLERPELERILTKAGADAFELGADVNKLVNVRRNAAGMSRAGGARRAGGRVMPETILERAGDDPAERLRLLEKYGYIRR